MLNPLTESPDANLLYDIKGARAFHHSEVTDLTPLGVCAANEITLVVELAELASYFLHLMAQKPTYPVPRHVVEAHGPTWTAIDNIVTNGPFRLVQWQSGQSMLLCRNPDYRGRVTGNVDQVEIPFLRNRPAPSVKIFEAYEINNLDVAFLELLEVGYAQQKYPGECISAPHLWVKYIGFNVNQSPFDDHRVRRTFALATDKEQWANIFLKGNEFPATGGFVPSGMPGHSPGIGIPYDPEQARHLLTEAGYPNGQGFPVVEFLARSGYEPAADYLQAQWREILRVEIKWHSADMAVLSDRVDNDPPAIFLWGYSADYVDPDSLLRGCLSHHFSYWQHPTYNNLIEQARRITDQQARLKLYQQADRIVIEEVVLMPLTYVKKHFLIKPWIKRFPLPTPANWHWQDVVIEPY